MTDEERQKLCEVLRTADELAFYWRKLAADEIERLAALAQSDAEPVAGSLDEARTIALEQRCERGTPWDLACVTIANKIGEKCGYPPIPTNTAPPSPDAFAGLIEAAEYLEANDAKWGASWSPCVMSVAKWLRSRAADRSGK